MLESPAKMTYTAANVTSLSLNEPFVGQFASYSCDLNIPPAGLLPPSLLLGSCAYTNIEARNTGTITLTGQNTSVDGHLGSGLSTQVATSVTVGLGPIVTGIANSTTGQVCTVPSNPPCVLTARPWDLISIWGAGFNPTGANRVKLDNPSTPAWLYETDGYYYWDWDRSQINAVIPCYVLPGSYTLTVWSPKSGTPSNSAQVSISAAQPGSCP